MFFECTPLKNTEEDETDPQSKIMKLRKIQILENDRNRKGDLFGRLMGDLFHALGYDEPMLNIHKSGREIDLRSYHRTEKKLAVAECKAHAAPIGGADINKFVGVFDAERKRLQKHSNKSFDAVGYFASLSGFTETALEQEDDLDNERVILLGPQKIVTELIKGKIIVPYEKAAAIAATIDTSLILMDEIDLIASKKGWVWAVYLSDNGGQETSHLALVHAEGKPLIASLASEILRLDKELGGSLNGYKILYSRDSASATEGEVDEARRKYFRYIENECGEIQFEGLPTDKDAGAVRVKLENIFVPLHLEEILADDQKESRSIRRQKIGSVLRRERRLAILAKPGGGKSTLIKRIAIAYAFPSRRKEVKDRLPNQNWIPIFIRCRELGERVTSSITDIITGIPNRAEITSCTPAFSLLISDALQKGEALLLIDGLDEIAEDQNRISFVNQLRTFIATYPNINLIVTSREAGFRVVGGSLASYCKSYTLSNLDNPEILDLTLKWHQAIVDHTEKTAAEARALARIILNDTRINELAKNPLLLTTLLFVKRWAGYLPTKKSVLYQEMIKLLLVTWNVEGHQQLDIDEAEPQLAFVSYWMTRNGEQTITEERLKKLLMNARQQMPEILNFTRISPADFIKRVESRSSLLIMSGHQRLETGEMSQIYEFLHLSFQEYLTAKAIVERFIPKSEADSSELELLKEYVFKENWKEVIPLVAVLSKTKSKDLIQYLIEKSKDKINRDKRERKTTDVSPATLLANCIASEVQISVELLESACEWIARNRYSRAQIEVGTILNSKFGETFQKRVEELFFSGYDEEFSPSFGGTLSDIYLFNKRLTNENEILEVIKEDIQSGAKIRECSGTLALMSLSFQWSRPGNPKAISRSKLLRVKTETQERQKFVDSVLPNLLSFLKKGDPLYVLAASWCLAWLTSGVWFTNVRRETVALAILPKWFDLDEGRLRRYTGWVLQNTLEPTTKIDFDSFPYFESTLRLLQKEPQQEFDRVVSVFLSIIAGVRLDRPFVEQLLRREMVKPSASSSRVHQFAEKLGIAPSATEGRGVFLESADE